MLFFTGFCPESELLGQKIKMRLNEDDFWESPATGLQILAQMPSAVILAWRGAGKFKKPILYAPEDTGLFLLDLPTDSASITPSGQFIAVRKELENYLNNIPPLSKLWQKSV